MTREEILGLEGEDLAAAVAEYVLELEVVGDVPVFRGWDGSDPRIGSMRYNVPTERQPAFVGNCVCEYATGPYSCRDYHGHTRTCLCLVPNYPGNIAAAWEVVEKVRTMGYSIGLLDYKNAGWKCRIHNQEIDVWATGRVVAHAISRAILLAVLSPRAPSDTMAGGSVGSDTMEVRNETA